MIDDQTTTTLYLSASQPTALGLVRLVARDIEHASTQED